MMSIDNATAAEWDALNKAALMTPRYVNAAAPKQDDVVNNPSHYNKGGMECINYIEQQLSPEAFKGYLEGNMIKYMHRHKYKNGLEDLKKAQWYLQRLTMATSQERNT
jgi:hypothetical protein